MCLLYPNDFRVFSSFRQTNCWERRRSTSLSAKSSTEPSRNSLDFSCITDRFQQSSKGYQQLLLFFCRFNCCCCRCYNDNSEIARKHSYYDYNSNRLACLLCIFIHFPAVQQSLSSDFNEARMFV